MIIIIDEGIDFSLFDGLVLSSAFENLLCAHFEGRHWLVFSKMDDIRFVMENVELSGRAFSVLKVLKNKFSETLSLVRLVDSFIMVVQEGVVPCLENGSHWKVPLPIFKDSQCVSVSEVMGENVRDADIFKFSAICYMKEEHINGVEVHAKGRGGGGSTCFQELEGVLKDKVGFPLVVTDSDRKRPNGALGDTAKNVASVLKQYNWPAKHKIIDVREIENLIPIGVVQELARNGKVNAEAADFISQIYHEDFYRFCEVKDGFWLFDIFDFEEGLEDRRYWLSVAEKLVRKSFLKSVCISDGGCEQGKKEACECCISPKLGDITKAFCEYLDTKSHAGLAPLANKNASAAWLSLGKVVFEWCLAPRKTRI